jgi:hypothetical protein
VKNTLKAKPISAATRAMLDELEEQDAAAGAAPEDKLEQIRNKVRELRELELEKAQLADKLKTVNIAINDVLWTKLPQIMDESGVPSVEIAADGNKPPYVVRVSDHYKANIPDETAPEAFELLRKMKSEDLIKTTFTVSFGLREAKATAAFEKLLQKSGVEYGKKQGVPWNTLTSWFRVEHKKKPLSARAMALIGASVGRVAEVVNQKKERK